MSVLVTAAQFNKLSRQVRARGRVRHVSGHMNKTEYEYSAYLDGLKALGKITSWKFEAVKLKLADKTYFTADFVVQDAEGFLEFVDVKATKRSKNAAGESIEGALSEDDAAVKVKVAAQTFPWFDFTVVFKRKSGYWERREFSS